MADKKPLSKQQARSKRLQIIFNVFSILLILSMLLAAVVSLR